jgi:hypothetical protein
MVMVFKGEEGVWKNLALKEGKMITMISKSRGKMEDEDC